MSDIITLCTAPAGSGKTFSRVRWLVDWYLPERDGVYWSNLPLHVDALIAFAEKRKPGSSYGERVNTIPQDVCEAWRADESGPWEFFKDKDLEGAHIAIDEAHEFIAEMHGRPRKRQWQKWLGQIRHRGCRVELITQHVQKLAREIRNEAGLRVELVNAETQRDPFFRVPLGDWYEMRAAWLTREYTACVSEIEFRQVAGRWVESDRRRYEFDPDYFALYDSYSTPETGGVKASAPLREFERRSRVGVTWWFMRRNWWRLGRSAAIAVGVATMPIWAPPVLNMGMDQFKVGAGAAGGAPRSEAVAGSPATSPAARTQRVPAKVVAEADRIGNLESDLAEARAELDEMKRRFALGFVLQGIAGDEALFANGGRYRVGERLEIGPYAGRQVRRIDWKRRAVVLDNGLVLRVGSDGIVPGIGPEPTVANGRVSERVPVDAKAPAGRPESRVIGRTRNAVDVGPGVGGVLPPPGGPGAMLDRGGRVVGPDAGDGRGPK